MNFLGRWKFEIPRYMLLHIEENNKRKTQEKEINVYTENQQYI
jgi:hypothetical protein